MTTLTQAQDLLRKWREAAGQECRGTTLTLNQTESWTARLWWKDGPVVVSHTDPDPLTAVCAAISQTPWSSVGDSDGPMPLFSTETEEQLRAQLAERDARIGELEAKCGRLTREKIAAIAKFREFRRSVELAAELVAMENLRREVYGVLDRFPDEPSEEGEG